MSADEIKKLVNTEKMVIGTDKVTSLAKQGKIEKIFIASNIPQELKSDLERYSKISGFELEQLDVHNEELGLLCKKSFSVSLVGRAK